STTAAKRSALVEARTAAEELCRVSCGVPSCPVFRRGLYLRTGIVYRLRTETRLCRSCRLYPCLPFGIAETKTFRLIDFASERACACDPTRQSEHSQL